MEKKRSRIIVDLIQGNIDVEQALNILDLLLEDIKDKKIKKWVDNEINGYKNEKDIPEYRNVRATIVGIIKTYTHVINNVNIPVPLENAKQLYNIKVKEGISEVIQMAKAEIESKSHNLQIPINLAYINSIAAINGEVTHANQELSLYAYNNIVGKLKNKLLSIFKELEKNYGNIYDYYID